MRLVVRRPTPNVIEAKVMSGVVPNDIVFIP